ncbi:MAG TPA: sugar ABC transporter permease, partial [Treponema sp.]|nr:sugar ABC transporter permease [Treponema sp.]
MILIAVFAVLCIFPFLLILGTSFSSEDVVRVKGFSIVPEGFTFQAYRMIFKNGKILLGSYIVTIIMTVTGTTIGLSIISMTGYALQRKDFPYRNIISFFIYFASLFSAGLAPYYLLMVRGYHLKDNYLAVLLPLLMSPWLIILMKNYVKSVPAEITESGKIDGAGDFRIFKSLIFPMLTPALATIGLFLALGYWNEWYQSSLFLSARIVYKPLQYMLYQIINQVAYLKNSIAGAYVSFSDFPEETL